MLKKKKKNKSGNKEFSENQDRANFQVFLMQVYNQNSLLIIY